MASVTVAPRASAAPAWARKYPPLLALGIAALLVLAVLPNSLHLPQTTPTTTLEYAPVPAEDDDDVPPSQNQAALGLGSSSGVQGVGAGSGGAAADPLAPGGDSLEASLAPVEGRKASATNKRCVGNPPRQTEDPLSPPCVAFFQGDNFGAT